MENDKIQMQFNINIFQNSMIDQRVKVKKISSKIDTAAIDYY